MQQQPGHVPTVPPGAPGTLADVATKRALVLAGGGLAGIGWETGILRGIADESPGTNVYDFAGGKIRRVRIFRDRREALEAVGLTE